MLNNIPKTILDNNINSSNINFIKTKRKKQKQKQIRTLSLPLQNSKVYHIMYITSSHILHGDCFFAKAD